MDLRDLLLQIAGEEEEELKKEEIVEDKTRVSLGNGFHIVDLAKKILEEDTSEIDSIIKHKRSKKKKHE